MKNFFIIITGLVLAFGSNAQPYMHGSIQRGVAINSVDILFKPTVTSIAGEYVNYLQFSLAIPQPLSTNVTASVTGIGNFATLTFVQDLQYTQGAERIFTWVCNNPGITTMSWIADVEFIGATVTFNGNSSATTLVRMLDLTNTGPFPGGGGGNGNTFFAITSSAGPDLTDYAAFFYANGGANGSTLGTYGTTNDQFVQTLSTVVLPIDLLAFTGRKDGSRNVLNWKVTCNNTPTATMVLERSFDGRNFSSIYSITATAAQCQQPFEHPDTKPIIGVNYYRLKMTDANGKVTYSNIIELLNMQNSFEITGIVPNPVTKNGLAVLKLSAATAGTLQLVVTDMAGKKIMAQTETLQAGNKELSMDFSKLSSGTYRITGYFSDGTIKTAAFVKQ